MACKACGTSAMAYVQQYRMGGGNFRRRGSWGMCFYYRR